jgi:DNA repair exonuclease SbcCD nuclease subunit
MAGFRFLHCADLHLDSPLRGLEADPDAPAETIRGATRQALRNLVDHALEERVDFVVAAGDLYDGDWQDWRTGRFLTAQIARLTSAGIPFIAIRGNHDAESVISRRLRMPSDIAWLLDHRRPETIRLPHLPVSIHGQSFANRSVSDNLARRYPPPDPGRFNIGLLHSALDGREGHDDYAPCSVEQLRDHGYEYWALGHVHQREIVHRDPWIVFPGNTQGRHANETGVKGATRVTVADGRVTDVAELALDSVRWARITIALPEDASDAVAYALIRDELAREAERSGPRLLATRITVTGASLVHAAFSRDLGAARENIRNLALEAAEPGAIWVESVSLRTRPPRAITALRGQSDAMGKLIQALETIPEAEILDEIRKYTDEMIGKGSALRQALEPRDDALADLVSRARDLLPGLLTD